MKMYFAQHVDGKVTWASFPIKETNAKSYEFEVSEKDLKDVMEGEKDFVIENGELLLVESNRKQILEELKEEQKQELIEKQALKEKLEKGEATPEEIQTLLAKLL